MLQSNDTVLVLIDIQGKLAQIVNESEIIVNNIEKVTVGARLLDLPVFG
ncbi:hypothetical protein JOD29_000132 [Lysinibacillus composti]|nr:hypothetical protein [Lysinibacillus composti]MBM7606895.1 hypothetical protein [Lysinibacillus composti]